METFLRQCIIIIVLALGVGVAWRLYVYICRRMEQVEKEAEEAEKAELEEAERILRSSKDDRADGNENAAAQKENTIKVDGSDNSQPPVLRDVVQRTVQDNDNSDVADGEHDVSDNDINKQGTPAVSHTVIVPSDDVTETRVPEFISSAQQSARKPISKRKAEAAAEDTDDAAASADSSYAQPPASKPIAKRKADAGDVVITPAESPENQPPVRKPIAKRKAEEPENMSAGDTVPDAAPVADKPVLKPIARRRADETAADVADGEQVSAKTGGGQSQQPAHKVIPPRNPKS